MIEIEFARRFQQHPRFGLSAFAIDAVRPHAFGCVVRAIVEAVEGRSRFGEEMLPDTFVDHFDFGFSEQPAGDPRLIRDDHDNEASIVRFANGGGGTGYPTDLIDCADVVRIVDDDAIAIEEKGGAWHGTVSMDDLVQIVAGSMIPRPGPKPANLRKCAVLKVKTLATA